MSIGHHCQSSVIGGPCLRRATSHFGYHDFGIWTMTGSFSSTLVSRLFGQGMGSEVSSTSTPHFFSGVAASHGD